MNCSLKKLSFIITIFYLLTNCSKKVNQDTFPTIVINPDIEIIEGKLSDIVSSVKIVSLETNLDCLIGVFSMLLYLDNQHIIFKSDKSVLIFNGEGKFLRKIDALGNGPEEYNNIISAFVDNNSKLIYVVDKNKVLAFNFNGKFKESFMSKSAAGLFKNDNKQFIIPIKQIYQEKNREMITVLDSKLNVVKSFKSRNYDEISGTRQNLFFAGNPYKMDNKVFYKEPFVDTIYQIKSDTLMPYLRIDLDGLGYKTKDGINTENYQKASKTKIPPVGIKESSNFFIFEYYYKNAKYLSVYNKRSKNYIFHKKFVPNDNLDGPLNIGINNDLIEGAPPYFPHYVQDNIMVSIIDPASLTTTQQNWFKKKEGDNQILFIANLKDQ